MNLAELIRAARMDQKLSQKALGKLISTAAKPNGVWSTYIGQIEKGDKIPSDDVCVELARILHRSPPSSPPRPSMHAPVILHYMPDFDHMWYTNDHMPGLHHIYARYPN